MMMPFFWVQRTAASWLLMPLSLVYVALSWLRRARVKPQQMVVPVICVGNNTAGGAGKTPTVIALAEWLTQEGRKPAVISRGYRGQYQGTIKVDPAVHDAAEVGDEPLLIAQSAACYVARRRVQAARVAIADGADIIIMDDGLQNPSLVKQASIMVVDGTFGFGNRFLIPAGPCRERIRTSIRKADMLLIMGEQTNSHIARYLLKDKPVFRGRLVASDASLKGVKVHPFAGIAHPDKFFETVASLGAEFTLQSRFADHHYYTQLDIERLRREAAQHGARLVTTAKDYVRLPVDFRREVTVIPVALQVDDQPAMLQQLMRLIAP